MHARAATTQQGFLPARLGLKKTITIWEYERGVLYLEGRYSRLLEPGYYTFWAWEKVRVERVPIRQSSEVISGQEILTADKIEVRVTLIAQYQIVDPALAINAVVSYSEQLYQDVQLTLRDIVAGRTLEELLEARETLAAELLAQVAPRAGAYGLALARVGIRDIILPGLVRSIMLKEVEADRIGRADLLRARHEVATARTRANTAKILSENPQVLRMQELDALLALADKSGNVVLLPNLASLLAPRAPEAPAAHGSQQ